MPTIHKLCGLWLLCCICFCCWTQITLTTADITFDASTPDGVKQIKVFTVASEPTCGYLQYISSARVNNIHVKTIGMDKDWKNPFEVLHSTDKIHLLREAIKPYQNEKQTIILFTDSYGSLFKTGLTEIYKKFKNTGAKVLFSAEKNDMSTKKNHHSYSQVSGPNVSHILNSDGFIGYAPQIYAILQSDIKDGDDDRSFYTNIFLREDLRSEFDIKLDVHSDLFQHITDIETEILMKWENMIDASLLKNLSSFTTASILIGNSPEKLYLNALLEYLPKPLENRLKLDENNLPIISLTILVTQPLPFFDMFLQKIDDLNYSKNKIHLFVYCNQLFHDGMVESFIKRLGSEYLSTKMISSVDEINEQRGRELALIQAQSTSSDYMLVVNADAHIDDPELLRKLLIANKEFVTPVLTKCNAFGSDSWDILSNFDISKECSSFVDMCNMPYVSRVYLIKNTAFKHMKYEKSDFDFDLAICDSLSKEGISMYVIGQNQPSHLVNTEGFNSSMTRPDFYTLLSNKYDWTNKYLYPDFYKAVNTINVQPCPNVFWFPVVTEAFCDDLIVIMKAYGKKTNGSAGIRNIALEDVGLEKLWGKFMALFVHLLLKKVYLLRLVPNPVKSFLERCHHYEQPTLHTDFDVRFGTINIALNDVGVDYQGGGYNFLRYKCTVKQNKKGWMMIHPGRLTHFHESLPVTNGTRYTIVSIFNSVI